MSRTSRAIAFSGAALFLGLGLALTTLVACGSSDEPATPPSSDDAGAADTGSSTDARGNVGDASEPDVLVDAAPPAITCATTPCAVEIATGFTSACVRISDGTVQCWGNNGNGELGRGPGPSGWADTAAPVVGLTGVTQISGSGSPPGDVYCARKSDGTAVCWGANANGVLGRKIGGDVDTEASPTAAPVAGLGAVTGVYAGYYVSCATLAGSEIACWGSNEVGQLPTHETAAGVLYPMTTFSVGATGTMLGVADRGTVALTDTGLVSWGLSGDPVGAKTGVLGREASTVVAAPGSIGLARVSAVAASAGRACAISNGRVFCWGVGPLPGTDSVYPTYVGVGTTLPFAQTIAVGAKAACATLSDGAAYCWGDNSRGQLGGGSFGYQRRPVRVEKLAGKPARMAAMEASTCAILENGAVQCWGQNDRGQLGIGTTDGLPHLDPQTVKFAP